MAIQNIYVTESTALNVSKYLGADIFIFSHKLSEPGTLAFVFNGVQFSAPTLDESDNTHVAFFGTASGDIACRFVIVDDAMARPVFGKARDDVMNGTPADDVLAGRGGNDRLTGALGADILDGGEGNDKMTGGAGDDTLTGFLGKDTFVFGAGSGDDVITDFDIGTDVMIRDGDRMSLKDILFASTASADGMLISFDGGDSVLLKGVSFTD